MIRTGYAPVWLVGALIGAIACLDDATMPQSAPPTGSTTGDPATTFDHDNDAISVWDLLKRLTEQGPPSFTSQMHACSKMHYATLGSVLRSFGVNLTSAVPGSAGQLYQSGGSTMGGPNYAIRLRESVAITTSQASREFDILASAAPEIIAALPTVQRCQIGGVAPVLFDASNGCHLEGITCLIGTPATQAHVDLCNLTIQRASTTDVGKRMAVAVMLAAAYTCE